MCGNTWETARVKNMSEMLEPGEMRRLEMIFLQLFV
jgi:hypothetical protein